MSFRCLPKASLWLQKKALSEGKTKSQVIRDAVWYYKEHGLTPLIAAYTVAALATGRRINLEVQEFIDMARRDIPRYMDIHAHKDNKVAKMVQEDFKADSRMIEWVRATAAKKKVTDSDVLREATFAYMHSGIISKAIATMAARTVCGAFPEDIRKYEIVDVFRAVIRHFAQEGKNANS
jgi:hypothetical protein